MRPSAQFRGEPDQTCERVCAFQNESRCPSSEAGRGDPRTGGKALERLGVSSSSPPSTRLAISRASGAGGKLGRGTAITTRLTSGPPENSCRPAADVLFRTVAQVYGGSTLAVVLTGMGQDGRRGAEALRAAGGEVVAQDQATSVVWGMPGAVVGAGLAQAVLPLAEIGGYLTTRLATHSVALPKVVHS